MSNEIGVQLNEMALSPGEAISGRAGWQLDKQPAKVAIRLFWYTTGKGSDDSELIDEVVLDDPSAHQLYDFSFELPVEPYSYHGKLLSIEWAIEVVAGKHSSIESFIMAPDGIVRDIRGMQPPVEG